MRKPVPSTVSAQDGSLGVRKVRSAAKMPMTTIIGVASAKRLGGLEDLGRMAGDRDLAPDPGDLAGLVDEEGAAIDPHVFLAVHGFLGPAPVALGHVAPLVGGEREGQVVFGGELLDRLHRVLGDTDDVKGEMAELGQRLLEGAGLLGAARRIRLGIEVEQQGLARVIAQSDDAVPGGRHLECGCRIAFVQAHGAVPLWWVALCGATGGPESPICRMKMARTSAAVWSMRARRSCMVAAPVAARRMRAEASATSGAVTGPTVSRSTLW